MFGCFYGSVENEVGEVYFKPTTAMRDAAVTVGDRRALMMRVVRDAVRAVVEVVLVGCKTRSVRSMMFGSVNSGARVAEERGVANAVGDARDEVRVLRDEGAAIWKPAERPAAVASGVGRESIVVRQKRESLSLERRADPTASRQTRRAVSGNRDADTRRLGRK